MFQLRAPYSAPILRRAVVRTGAAPDVWVVVSTTLSRTDLASKSDLKVGDVVRFTAQYGIRPKDDDTNLVVYRGTIVGPRTPLLPDSYAVRADEAVESWKLDPTTPTPVVGSTFLVAPWSIAAVESTTSASAPPPATTESFAVESPVPAPAPIPDASAKVVKPEELTGTAPAAQPPEPLGASTMTYVGIGAIVALVAAVLFVVR
jgi:hypothetical protein